MKDNDLSIENIDNETAKDNELLTSSLIKTSESDYNLMKNEQIIDGRDSGSRHQFKIITYAGFKLLIDEHCWFNASNICVFFNKNIYDFNILIETVKLKDIMNSIFGKNIEYEITNNRQEIIGKYFHPILFLKLACWLSVDFYEAAALIVLSQYTGEDVELVKELTKNMITDQKMEIGQSLEEATIIDKIKNVQQKPQQQPQSLKIDFTQVKNLDFDDNDEDDDDYNGKFFSIYNIFFFTIFFYF